MHELQEYFEEIIDFAELWEFLEAPLKNFSSGMVARLGFSIATIRKPEILIVDEILGVGDYRFQRKCEKKINSIIEGGATVIFVSHSSEQLVRVCGEAVWLEGGRLIDKGSTDRILSRYMTSAADERNGNV
jgi:ABC-type polysaccharide/polyol phosphate transport system ATPase subunit